MGGSSGGLDHYWARHVASRGYNVLNLAYFNYPGLPDTCTNLPLEYFKTAIDWLKHRTGANRVGIQGASRGGEAVLLITTAFPEDIACTVSYVPMHITTGGFIPETTENVASWTLNGEDIPYVYTPVPTEEECRARGIDLGRGLPIAPFYYDFIAEAEKNEDMWIPIERSTAPLLMVTAKDDAIWACSYGAERVKERIAKYNGSVKAEHLAFDGAGHLMPPEGTITSLSTSVYHQHGRILIALGGTPAVNAHAGEKAWRRTIDFYAEHLL
ncbi:MAG: acyl-CoA thioester hydrolase/BAAT C-terminal domain-containing protein [Pseudomonadota bacterium]